MTVAMCPTLKLKWFSDNGYSFNEIQKIRNLVIGRFYESYTVKSSQDELLSDSKPTIEPNGLHPTKASTNMLILGVNLTFIAQRVNKYLHKHNVASAQSLSPVQDSIEQYLTDEVVPESMIAQHGGLIQYCTNQLIRFPRVYTMALDYLTAPASSVDAERAFSNGRLMVNHLQHQMSTRTFQAKMAVGSWVGTPLLSDLTAAAAAVQATM